MSDYSFLKPGLWWARHKLGPGREVQWSRWVVVRITGKFPFMKAEIIFKPPIDGAEVYESISDIDKWQFADELMIPSTRYERVERAKDVK